MADNVYPWAPSGTTITTQTPAPTPPTHEYHYVVTAIGLHAPHELLVRTTLISKAM